MSSRTDQYKASSNNCSPCLQAFYMAESTYSTPSAPHVTSRLPAILPGRNSILSSRQHPHNPYSSPQVHSYRILTGEIGFIPKGLSIVCPCNTKVSVLQFTCYKNINSIQSSSNPCEDTVHYLQSKLS